MATRIDGKAIAAKVRAEVAEAVARLKETRGVTPGLATILVGDDPASQIYVRNKHRACKKAGIASFEHRLEASISEAALIERIERLNEDPAVHGILVQLPLSGHLDADRILERIRPEKDVDGFHPVSAGHLLAGQPGLRPCTPLGILRLLDETGVALEGKRALVVGRSKIVGKPMALLLLERNATVTIAHSRTRDLPERVAEAEILVAAVGRPGLIRGAWIREGAVVIDVGIHRTEAGLTGDVEYEAAAERAFAITPVPGGVGPMTIAMLLSNTLQAAKEMLP